MRACIYSFCTQIRGLKGIKVISYLKDDLYLLEFTYIEYELGTILNCLFYENIFYGHIFMIILYNQ